MKIANIEKLAGHEVIVMTGRDIHILAVASQLVEAPICTAPCYPDVDDYFMDYPDIARMIKDDIPRMGSPAIFSTQSAEFLDCLLNSDLDFILATVRQVDGDEYDYRLRVLSKEEALENRRDFNMELRV